MFIEKEIYEYIKTIIYNEKLTFYFQNLDKLEENACGVFLLGSIDTIRSVSALKYRQYTNQLVINLNTDTSLEGFEFGFEYGEYIIDRLSKVVNKELNTVFISRIDLETSTNYLGREDQGLNKFSYNFTIYYSKIYK